jgi:DNA-binding Xre family transcriptional regulator
MDSIIGHNIKTLLNRRAMKQADVVRRTGMLKSHLSEIINGHNRHPSVWTCAKIAEALRCSIDDLVRIPLI